MTNEPVRARLLWTNIILSLVHPVTFGHAAVRHAVVQPWFSLQLSISPCNAPPLVPPSCACTTLFILWEVKLTPALDYNRFLPFSTKQPTIVDTINTININQYSTWYKRRQAFLFKECCFSCTGCQPEKTTLHRGQSRSWSAEQGKKKKKKSGSAPPPQRCLFGEKKI